ncbi:hypothetical protein ABZP36_013352 [Zizania latifolia]
MLHTSTVACWSAGYLNGVWIARKPPGFAFVDFDDKRDAEDALCDLNGKNGWKVELSHNSSGRGGRDRHAGSEKKCYECGEAGHFALECCLHGNVDKGTICSMELDPDKAKQLSDAIESLYWFEFFIGFVGEVDRNNDNKHLLIALMYTLSTLSWNTRKLLS